jgi:hypothetical protein
MTHRTSGPPVMVHGTEAYWPPPWIRFNTVAPPRSSSRGRCLRQITTSTSFEGNLKAGRAQVAPPAAADMADHGVRRDAVCQCARVPGALPVPQQIFSSTTLATWVVCLTLMLCQLYSEGAAGVGATAVGAAGVGASDVGAAGVGASGVGAAGLGTGVWGAAVGELGPAAMADPPPPPPPPEPPPPPSQPLWRDMPGAVLGSPLPSSSMAPDLLGLGLGLGLGLRLGFRFRRAWARIPWVQVAWAAGALLAGERATWPWLARVGPDGVGASDVGAAWAHLTWARLAWARLAWARLAWARLLWARLAWAYLAWARLTWARLLWARLAWACLTRGWRGRV